MDFCGAVQALASRSFAPAIATFLGYISHDRTDGNAWLYLGIAYTESGLLADSLHALHIAELLIDDNPELSQALGVTHLRSGDLPAARRHLEKSLNHSDPPASIHRNIAILYLQSGEIDRALHSIDSGIEKNPDDVLSLYAKA
ncbi:MAG: hypothetical protein EA426_13955 [Spirochaetaceae bacterium]|nr:MAG: hypothetical protein EA426_13955 [Spirochaetaceae bacterium]